MYFYTLKICIISHNNNLENRLKAFKPKERFAHSFKTVSSLEDADKDSDIFISEGREDILKELNGIRKKNSFAVYYGGGLKDESWSLIDEYWNREGSVDFYFNALLNRIKLIKDNRLSANYLNTLIDNTPDLVWFKDTEGSHVKVNDSFCRAVNKTKAQVEGRGHYYIWDITPEDYSKGEYVCLESEDMVMEAGHSMVFDEQVKTKDGMRMFITTKSPIFDEFNNIMGTVGQAHDITALSNISQEMNLFIENMPFGVIVSDKEDIITNANSMIEEITGWSAKGIIGWHIKLEPEMIAEVLLDTEQKKVTILELETGSGHKILEMTKIHITDVFKKHMGIMRIFRDITSERELEQQVARSANTDFLTGLYNRRYFYEYINTNCMGKAVSILSMDLDNFKGINDNYGHHAGDEALVLTARVLRDCFDDELIVRNGGDEFLVVLMEDDLSSIEKKAVALLEKINAAFAAVEEFKGVTASVGVAVTTSLDNDLDAILQKSDTALYSAKKHHKGSYCISR